MQRSAGLHWYYDIVAAGANRRESSGSAAVDDTVSPPAGEDA